MLSTQPIYRIAVLLPIDLPYSNQLIEGALSYVEQHPEVELVELPYAQQDLASGHSPLPAGAWNFDGLMLHLSPRDAWVERLLAERAVFVNTSGEWLHKQVPTIVFDAAECRRLAFDHLVGLGRHQLAYIGADTRNCEPWVRERTAFIEDAHQLGLQAATLELGLLDNLENRLMRLSEEAAGRLREFLGKLPKPAAIWCEDDYVARLVCDHARAGGWTIPEDLAVLGFRDLAASRVGKPSISTIPAPGRIIGNRALKWLHQMLAGVAGERMVLRVPLPPVLIRESTGGGLSVDKRLKCIRQWIHEHACEGLTVEDLLKDLPMSQPTFTKQFLRAFGRTPGEEIRHVKIARAKHYLRATFFSVERIAGLCGFDQPGKFSTFFRRQTDQTPSEYRQGKCREE